MVLSIQFIEQLDNTLVVKASQPLHLSTVFIKLTQ